MNEGIPKSNVMKDEFGWEVPVESVPLPSRGVIYSPDSLLYNTETLQIKAMTAKEEDILTSQAFIKENVVVEKLIESCLIEKSIDVSDLITGDRNALMVSIRITGYGTDYNVTHSCENCSNGNKINVDLSQLSIKRLEVQPVESGKNIFEYILPVTKKKVHFKFLNGHDQKEMELIEKRLKKAGINYDNTVTGYLENTIISVDGVTDKNKIKHFILNMPALDSRKLRKHIRQSEPGIDMKWEYDCGKCGHHNDIQLPITTEFFWPST
jgi:hypothetical protein